jgi:hypothetical protein
MANNSTNIQHYKANNDILLSKTGTGLEQAQRCDGVKPLNEIPFLFS